ncbi:MAG: GDSL-type esterase/lipase family protein [Haloarculaceae archaeon]
MANDDTRRDRGGRGQVESVSQFTATVESRFPKSPVHGRVSDYDRDTHAYEDSYVHPDEYRIMADACTEPPPDPGTGTGGEREPLETSPVGPQRPTAPGSTNGVIQRILRTILDAFSGLLGGASGAERGHPAIESLHWQLIRKDDETIVDEVEQPNRGPGSCRTWLTAPGVGDYRVKLQAARSTGVDVASRSVRMRRDRLIVSIGDSFASGQGVPDRPDRSGRPGTGSDPVWVEPEAYRSFRSGPALAARDIEDRTAGDLVSFLSFATSGATIRDGLLSPQHHWQAVGQIEEAKRTVGDRSIDALLLSIGGNDVGFASGLKELTAGFSSHGDIAEEVEAEIERLEDKFDTLATAIDDLDPDHVFITEYPIAFFDVDDDGSVSVGCGVFTDAPIGGFGISEEDALEIKRLGKLLNKQVEDAAERHDWTYVDGVVEGFRGHGYCRGEDRYFVTWSESTRRQNDHKGVMHPDQSGHEVIADRIVAAMRASPFSRPPPAEEEDDEGDNGRSGEGDESDNDRSGEGDDSEVSEPGTGGSESGETGSGGGSGGATGPGGPSDPDDPPRRRK